MLETKLGLRRTVLAAVFASALPVAALAHMASSGASGSQGSMGSSSMGSNMKGPSTMHPTTGAYPTSGSVNKSGGSPWVKSIQAALNRKQHSHLLVDGKIGRATRTALEKFQKSHGIKPTGHVNKATAKALGM